uniref:Globin family profile domain-containing protein n=3 Tax=Wuchereria bancrofti TaxID=6293 RepID=A0AAF5PM15_WUCBA
MGNHISWNKRKKAIIDKLNNRTGGASRKMPDSSRKVAKCQISVKCGKYIPNQQQMSTVQELFPERLKSNLSYDKNDKVIKNHKISTQSVNGKRWKSNSESDTQLFIRPKLVDEMKCDNSSGQRKNTGSVAKRNQSLTRIRSSNLNESRQYFRNNNSDYRGTHPISPQGREIIQACFGNHHNEIGYRICMRVFEKRTDYQRFVYALGRERWLSASVELRDYLNNVVSKVHNVSAVEEMSRHYGERHVPLKKYGFKPDFWVSIADAMAVECVILDMANHQPTETVMAWSQLTSLMFTSIRDGYYAALRFQRQTLKKPVDSIKSSKKSATSIAEKFVS